MIKKLYFTTFLLIALFITSCRQNSSFYSVENGKFVKNGVLCKFVGTNFWYGTILASEGNGGDRTRLHRELDEMKSLGINNLRILVGAEGESGSINKTKPALHISPEKYNDTLLKGLDYLMYELGKRDMCAVLYLTNAWDWSGGFGQYLEWSGHEIPSGINDNWDLYQKYMSGFFLSEEAKSTFKQFVKTIISRKNTITGKPYIEDEAIFSWQICNEPRPFSKENKDIMAEWIKDIAQTIRSIDENHMISTGSEGFYGCEEDMFLYEKISSYPEISYMNAHIWPYNWNWISSSIDGKYIENAKKETMKYLEKHLLCAATLNKPLVVEEFGYPRDNFGFTPGSSVKERNSYYEYLFSLMLKNEGNYKYFAGCNFWAWGGFANPEHIYWEQGDDFTGDPPHEQQGLNSVFSCDSTTKNIILNVNTTAKGMPAQL